MKSALLPSMGNWSAELARAVTDRGDSSPVYDVAPILSVVGSTFSTETHTTDRVDAAESVELLEDGSSKILSAPLDVDAVIDGIQASFPVAWSSSRPVRLGFVAAGAAVAGPDLAGVVERLFLVASEADKDFVTALNTASPAVPVHWLSEDSPPDVERASNAWVSTAREAAERDMAAMLLEAGAGYVLLDGDLHGRASDPRLVSCVKSARTRYLEDESAIFSLEAGWRSAIFKMAVAPGSALPRYSCYVRLQPHFSRPWDHGLIRLEAYDAELLPPLAAFAWNERQLPGSPDPRWDRHLSSVRVCEQLLRERRPSFF